MAIPQSLIDAMNKLDTETNELADVVRQLRERINASMSQADVDSVRGTLDALATRLDGIAADPNNPIPPGPQPTVAPSP